MNENYGNNIIITESSKNLRALGRNALAGNWKVAIITVLVYTLLIQVPTSILNELFGLNFHDLYNQGYYSGISMDVYSNVYNVMPSYSPLGGLYEILVTGPLELGLALFFLAMFRRQLVEVTDIFLGFEKFGKALGLLIYMSIFIFLWSLLFIIPGIIAAFRYSQAFYILADDPQKGIKQCVDESKYLMKGNKMKYFCLSLSFFGWALLAGIINGVIVGFAEALGLLGIGLAIVNIVASLVIIPVTVYMQSTFVGFYEILAGHLIKSTEPTPIEEIAVVATPEPASVVEVAPTEDPSPVDEEE